jgi:hypothetical protein
MGLMGPPGLKGDQGLVGSIASDASVKETLKGKGMTLWCADGNLCEAPKGKGISLESGQPILLRDEYHGIKWSGIQNNYDGPAIYGWKGGVLRTKNNDDPANKDYRDKLSWNRDGVSVDGKLRIGNWTITDAGDNLQIKKDNKGITIWQDGNVYSDNLGWVMGQSAKYAVRVNLNNQFADFGKSHTTDKNQGWVKVNFERF